MTPSSLATMEPSGPARPASTTQRRWRILYEQLQCGHEPCFQSDKRHACPESDCPWRIECVVMRAEWRR